MGTWFFHLQVTHSILSTSFLVVFAFFLRMGLDWPPKPACFRSYLRKGRGEEEEEEKQEEQEGQR